jgi:hypothetical protein
MSKKSDRSEYERFEELARRLTKVPKKEVDDLEQSKKDREDNSEDDVSEDREA